MILINLRKEDLIMDQDKKQAIALMRYSAIAPLISNTQTDYDSLNSFFREVSAKGQNLQTENYGIMRLLP